MSSHLIAILIVYVSGAITGMAVALLAWARSERQLCDELFALRRLLASEITKR